MELDTQQSLLSADPSTNSGAGPSCLESTYGWERHYAELKRFVAKKVGGRQDPDDVVQDIYKALLHSQPRIAVQNPRAWIWKIAWRVLNDAFQRETRRRKQSVPLGPKELEALANRDQFGMSSGIDAQIEAAEELLSVLEGLPLACQIAIVRSRRDGWSYEQIGRELGVSSNMVKKHITRALTHFDAYLEKADRESAGKAD
jgi:RNA polymerase sigma factor (sigma-70 family)